MRATGLFFLRTRPYTARGADGELRVLLPVVERVQDEAGRWVTLNELLASWKGPAAHEFYRRHQDDLVPGRGLDLELDRLRGHDGQWKASVTTLALAPLAPSWQKRCASTGDNTDQPQAVSA